jgi:hypothetical protein
MIYQRIKLSVLACVVAIALPTNAAKAQEILPLFGDVTIGNRFSPDPIMMRGMSGGPTSGRSIAGRRDTPTGACTGFFDEKPDHTLQLTHKFNYLRLRVLSPEDTTLIVKGPDGIWCSDDFKGQNPEIVGQWLPGQYQLWIGSFGKNLYFPYTIEITEVK